MKKLFILSLSFFALMFSANSAHAVQAALDHFNAHYGLKVTSCSLCHSSVPAVNNFGANFKTAGGGKPSFSAPNFVTLDSLDADGNNIPNGQQIAAGNSPANAAITLASLSTGGGAVPLGTASVTGCITASLQTPMVLLFGILALGFVARKRG